MAARTFRRRWGLGIGAGVVTLASVAAWGCNVPVFRYALENWQPDSYQVLVLARGTLNEPQQAAANRLAAAGVDADRPANLQVHSIDLQQQSLREALTERLRTGEIPDWNLESLNAWASQLPLDDPLIVAFYPGLWDRIAWQSTLSTEHAEQLIDSPLRQEVARRLLDGQSAVWVFLESGDTQQDDATWELLQRELLRSSSVVQLPARELIETDEYYRPEVEIDLRVEFSAVRLSANDPAEQAFAALLRGSEPDLREFDEPIAVPLYGRGRTYFALVGAGLNATTIDENGQFLCGACSCQVKQDNPGLDMLMAVNWSEQVQGTAMPPVVLPELTGLGALDMAQTRATSRSRSNGASPATVSANPAAGSNGPLSDVPATTVEVTPADPLDPLVRPLDDNSLGETAEEMSAESYSVRLLEGMIGGVVAALAVLLLASVWLRRTL
jgi:hypothetical protein